MSENINMCYIYTLLWPKSIVKLTPNWTKLLSKLLNYISIPGKISSSWSLPNGQQIN